MSSGQTYFVDLDQECLIGNYIEIWSKGLKGYDVCFKSCTGKYASVRVIKIEFTLSHKTIKKPDIIYKTTTLKTLDIM